MVEITPIQGQLQNTKPQLKKNTKPMTSSVIDAIDSGLTFVDKERSGKERAEAAIGPRESDVLRKHGLTSRSQIKWKACCPICEEISTAKSLDEFYGNCTQNEIMRYFER